MGRVLRSGLEDKNPISALTLTHSTHSIFLFHSATSVRWVLPPQTTRGKEGLLSHLFVSLEIQPVVQTLIWVSAPPQ